MNDFPVRAASPRLPSARRLTSLAAALALPLCLLSNPASAANCSAAVTSGGVYSIVNAASGKALDVVAGSTQGAAEVQQWGYGAGATSSSPCATPATATGPCRRNTAACCSTC